MRIRITLDVELVEDANPETAAEQMFNLAASDPDDVVPGVEVVETYDWQVIE